MIHRVAAIVENVLNHLIVWCGLFLLAALLVQVINRYVLAISWPFIQMLIPLCFVWLSMLGAAVAVRRKLHFEIDLISPRLGHKALRCYLMGIAITVILAGIITLWAGVGFLKLGLLKKDPATGVPMAYAFAAILMGGVLMCLFALEQFWKYFRHTPQLDEDSKA